MNAASAQINQVFTQEGVHDVLHCFSFDQKSYPDKFAAAASICFGGCGGCALLDESKELLSSLVCLVYCAKSVVGMQYWLTSAATVPRSACKRQAAKGGGSAGCIWLL